MGSGLGLQLITLLKLNPALEFAVGVELDARARNVSRFNLALNGVEQRATIVEEGKGLESALNGRKLTLGFSNPPFVAAPRESLAMTATQCWRVHRFSRSGFPLAGWGGHDGLRVTREFVQHSRTILESSAR